ncbi:MULTISPECIES: response regulator transcription factor [unclassified Meiothermus]|uniref:response regulator n=1 Tax=unclassified Meiothermus TaxID=370471 RepID=UPI000D7CD9A7|nr:MULTISPECIES: response regulator transcription factor [unclassified Meiothermus]PZA08120.1 DNA-binding response regulator [Meiothermus sp. Pnk-1]RYM31391.1 response regulator transcription factor [Meiothermus sp. PNK-Is4]
MPLRLLIVDDHPIVREGLKAFLGLYPDLEVVGETDSGEEALNKSRALSADLVLLDLQLSDGHGLGFLPRFLSLPNPPKVLILTSFLEEDSLRQALSLGASGYLVKHAGPVALLEGIRAAGRGEVPLDPAAVRLLTRPAPNPLASLTPKEREVLSHLAQGMSNKAIAQALGVSEKTVKTHVSSLLAKLNLKGRTQAALFAKEQGL